MSTKSVTNKWGEVLDHIFETMDLDHITCPKCEGFDDTSSPEVCDLCCGLGVVDYNTSQRYLCLGYKNKGKGG